MNQLQMPARNHHSQFPANARERDSRLVEGILANLPLFHRVPRHAIAGIAQQSRTLNARRGTVLIQRGERMTAVFAFAYGSAKLALRRRDGEEKVIRFLHAGDAFGEAAALQERDSPVDAVALSDSMLVLIPPAPLTALVDQEPRFASNLVRLLSDKFLGLVQEFESSVHQTALQRLAAYLESLAEPNGSPDTWVARLPASKTAVAARLGITKETMSRLLRELANRRLIAVERREIELRDLAGLAQVAR